MNRVFPDHYPRQRKADVLQIIGEFRDKRKSTTVDKVFASALLESLNKRITYMKGEKIIRISDYAKKHDLSSLALLNKAKRQTIPVFREKGVWKIGER